MQEEPKKDSRKCMKRWRKNFRWLKDLTLRRFKSNYHEEAWSGFERALYLRTMGCLLTRNFLALIHALLQRERYHVTKELFEEGTLKGN